MSHCCLYLVLLTNPTSQQDGARFILKTMTTLVVCPGLADLIRNSGRYQRRCLPRCSLLCEEPSSCFKARSWVYHIRRTGKSKTTRTWRRRNSTKRKQTRTETSKQANANLLQQVQSSQSERPLEGTRYVRHNGHYKTQGPRQRSYAHAMGQLAKRWLHISRSKALAANE